MSRSRIPVIGLVAASGTGKTTLLKKLMPVLTRRGLRVGYLKHAHHSFDLDVPGKDSYEIREAGAVQTLLASSERWALQARMRNKGEDPSLEEMLARFDPESLDLVLVEGFKHAAYPKIELHRTIMGKPLLYPDDPDIVAVVTDRSLPPGDHPPELPPEDPEAIADFILGHIETCIPSAGDLREDLVRHYRWLRRYGYNDSHSGNASVRVGDGFWVTPTGACADTLEADDLLLCPLEGPCPQDASLDAPLHQLVYQRQAQATAMLHSHGPYSVAMSFAGQDFRPVDFEGQYYFERVPVLPIDYADYLELAPEAVADALAEQSIAMVRGHGIYAWGETLNRAYKWTCSLELSAKTYVIARQAAAF
ncbi:MAG: molybdopterin-guanine dinucleotide biosynthesis protein B [Pseudomonadota bacterium]|nr:molybdopterin-guanine dinucleotide biosynthesis protein B [Pseudomonadota bacterium]